MIDTIVVCARGFKRELLKGVVPKNALFIGINSNAQRGHRVDTVIFAGFSNENPPSDSLASSVMACLASSTNPTLLFTDDGITFKGRAA